MGLKSDIRKRVREQLSERYKVTKAHTVPSRESLTFGATAKKMWGRAVYIDVRGSRDIVSKASALDALKVHKSFLYAVAKCIRNEGGEPRSFGGDSVLSFFPGKGSDVACSAVRAAMKVRYAVDDILNPIIKDKFAVTLNYGIGIGQGPIYVGKSGIAGDESFQDLVWLGFAVYHAVAYGDKASTPKALWISDKVYQAIKDEKSVTHSNDKHMWVWAKESIGFGTFKVHKTTYRWVIK